MARVSARDEAEALIQDGFRVWPISRGTKTPARAGFKREHGPVCASVDEFTEATEVGVLCGPCTAAGPGARFVCLDYDGPVPTEHRVGGEPTLTSKNGAHEWYRVPTEVVGFRQSQRVRRGDGWAVDTRDFGGYAIETKNGEALWDDGVPSLPRDITQAEVNTLFPPSPVVAPAVPPATGPRVAPAQAWVNAFVARVLGRPEGTNDCFGAVGSVLAASGWTNDEIALALDTWFGDYPLGRHRTSALSAADKRRAGIEPVPGFPKLAELGIPWVENEPDYLDISALMLSESTTDDEAELRAAIGGEWVQGAQVTAKVTPPNWLVAKLGLAPGRYAGLSGYASAGKTWFAQGLVMAVAQGTPFCGLGVRQGRALHIDHEQGSDMTRERYQLLGFDGGTEDLAYVSFPAWRLSGKDGKQLLFRLARGRALIVIDSLRASIGGDENSSEIRQWLDGVSEVSEATQCTMLVLHHARKGSTSGDSAGDDMYKARGSSGIVDAAGTFWHLNLQDRDPHEDTRPPSMLVQTKPGRHPPGGVIGETPFIIRPNSDGSVTLSLDTSRPEPSTQLEQYTARILKCLAGNPRRIKSANKLVDAVGGDRNAILKALQALKEDGCVIFHNGALMLQEQL